MTKNDRAECLQLYFHVEGIYVLETHTSVLDNLTEDGPAKVAKHGDLLKDGLA